MLYNDSGSPIGVLPNAKEIKRTQSTSGTDTLEFQYPIYSYYGTNEEILDDMSSQIHCQYFIETEDQKYVIKKVNPQNGILYVTATVYLDELTNTTNLAFSRPDEYLGVLVTNALNGTGWGHYSSINTEQRSLAMKTSTALDIVKKVAELFMTDLKFDAKNKIVHLDRDVSENKGVFFDDKINLISLNLTEDTEDLVTRLIPIGKDNLDITEVNDGLSYVENHQYTAQDITAYWASDQYTNAEDLKEDAIRKLSILSQPKITFDVNVLDLARIAEVNRWADKYDEFEYNLGDTITIMDRRNQIRRTARIVQMVTYPENPSKNTLQLDSEYTLMEDYFDRITKVDEQLSDITTATGEVNGDKIDGVSGDKVDSIDWTKVQNVQIVTAQIGDAQITNAKIKDAEITTAKIGDAQITAAKIKDAEITTAKIQDASITDAKIHDLSADKITAGTIDANFIRVINLNADWINAGTINANLIGARTITADKIAANSITATEMKTGTITADSGIIADAAIGNAQIQNLAVTGAKIASATIDTANIKNGAITNALIGTSAINTVQIADGSITDAKIVGLTASKITAGTLDAGTIDVINLNASNITVGTINGQQIAPGAIDLNHLGADVTGEIDSKATQEDINTSIDGIEIGGRNLIRNSDFSDGISNWGHYGNHTASLDTDIQYNGINSIKIVASGGGGSGHNIGIKVIGGIKNGQQYSLTFYAKGSVGDEVLHTELWGGIGQSVVNVTSDWQKYIINTLKGSTSTQGLYFWLTQAGTVNITLAKLEEGNKATDWTPAPEDIQQQFTDLNTDLQAIGTTANGKNSIYRQATQPTGGAYTDGDIWFDTANDNRVNVYDGASWVLNGLGNTAISNLDAGKITTGTLSADRIAANSIGGDKITANSIAVNKVTSDFGKNLDISSNAGLILAVDSIQIGGRNLLLNSNFANGFIHWKNNGATYTIMSDDIFGQCCKVVAPAANKGIYQYFSSDTETINNYTISGWLKADTATTINFGRDYAQNAVSITTEWQRFMITISSNTKLGVIAYSRAGLETFYIANVKVERGNKATDWTPAPEDIDAAISLKVSQTDYTGNTIASLINQTATTVTIDAGKINLNGYVTVSSLQSGGSTIIDGSRIRTGTLDASLATIINLNASNINAGLLQGNLIAGSTITGDKIVAEAITSREIASKTITANEIASNTITAAQMKTGTITAASGVIGSIDASVITTGTLDASKINVTNLVAHQLQVTQTNSEVVTIDAQDRAFVDNNIWCRYGQIDKQRDNITSYTDWITYNDGTQVALTDSDGWDWIKDTSTTKAFGAGTGKYPFFIFRFNLVAEYNRIHGGTLDSTGITALANAIDSITFNWAAKATDADLNTLSLNMGIWNPNYERNFSGFIIASPDSTTIRAETVTQDANPQDYQYIKNVLSSDGYIYLYAMCNSEESRIEVNVLQFTVHLKTYSDTIVAYGTTLVDAMPDINGGRIYVYNNSGDKNVTIGSSGFAASNRGGTLILHDNDESHKVEMGISSQYDAGLINVYGSSTDYAATLYANNQGNGPTVYLKNGTDYSALTSSDLYVERNQIVSNGHLYHIGRGSVAYSTSITLSSNSTTTITHSLGYYPIVQLDGNTGNNVLTVYHNSTSQITIRNYSSGGNSWSGTVRLY
ncbi:Prophage endopeptidase tail [Clostridium luticellarii]|uniref:Prophage endopeptidase tail n=2 Tax=Clostridium luticellarii TaxID=1691940 RepID=A0A2T0BLI1_9CLOT|nr:Prophage endopeptidase tail [Clostridium luticellarii]